MNQDLYIFQMIVTAGAVTIALRAFPFLVMRRTQKPPAALRYIGRVLPPAAISMLIVYCFASVFADGNFAMHRYGLAELSASVLVVSLQLRRKNPLLSIAAGTILYMFLLRCQP